MSKIANANESLNIEIVKKALEEQSLRLSEAVDAVLQGMDSLNKGQIKENSLIREEIRTQAAHIRDEIKGLKADLSDAPSRAEFEDIKTRLQKLENTMLQSN